MVKFHNATIFSDIWPWYISVKRLPNRFLRTDQNVRIDNKTTKRPPSHRTFRVTEVSWSIGRENLATGFPAAGNKIVFFKPRAYSTADFSQFPLKLYNVD